MAEQATGACRSKREGAAMKRKGCPCTCCMQARKSGLYSQVYLRYFSFQKSAAEAQGTAAM
jgi:hypothetical protein